MMKSTSGRYVKRGHLCETVREGAIQLSSGPTEGKVSMTLRIKEVDL